MIVELSRPEHRASVLVGPLDQVDLTGVWPRSVRGHVPQQPDRGPGSGLRRELSPDLVVTVGSEFVDV